MNIAFIGSVSTSWHTLNGLIRSGVEITAVLGADESQRNKISGYTSLSNLAKDAGIPFHSFIKISDLGVEEFLIKYKPDMIWVIGISQLVPKKIMDIASYGCVGFHPTMLPEGRGRAPIAWTILKKTKAAINFFYLTEEADAGDIIVQKEIKVFTDDYSEDLICRIDLALEEVVSDLAPLIKDGSLSSVPQNHREATYYLKRTPDDGLINFSETTDSIYSLVRAAGRPYSGSFIWHNGRKLIIWKCKPEWLISQFKPGCVLKFDKNKGVLISTLDGGLWATEVEYNGLTEAEEFLKCGDRFKI
jgi:methionyl-tRNA formyltransferase